MQLTNKQIKKANKLLDLLCKSKQIEGEKVYPLFESNVDAEYVCSELEKEQLLKVIRYTDNGIAKLLSSDKTCDCVENNRLDKESSSANRNVLNSKLNIFFLIVSLILNIILIGNNFLKSENHNQSKDNLDDCKIHESKLNHVIDSLTLDSRKLQDKVTTLEKEVKQLRQN